MRRLPVGRRRVVVGRDDPSVTPRAGLSLVAELDRVLGIESEVDAQVGAIKARAQGLGAGGLLLSMAETMLAGGDFMSDLDRHRGDVAGLELRAVPGVPASTTFISLAKQFGFGEFAGIEAANAVLVGRWFNEITTERRRALQELRPTIDLDPTDVEVFGQFKEGVAYNYAGAKVGRPFVVTWAEAGLVLTADLGDGATDPRPGTPSLIARAVKALPGGLRRPIVRTDSGMFDGKVAKAAIANGCDFAIAANRTTATWRAVRQIPDKNWWPAIGMAGAEVAVCDYAPAGWPPGTRCVVRRVRVNAEEISGDSRSRRRRTIDPDQLQLALDGQAGHVYAYTFICTNLTSIWLPTFIEFWFRQRALVEERIKDSKGGTALRHLPSGYKAVNTAWMWAALLALNISAFLQTITDTDITTKHRAHGKRLRYQLICICARVIHHSRQTVLRLAPSQDNDLFIQAWETLRNLSTCPRPTGPYP